MLFSKAATQAIYVLIYFAARERGQLVTAEEVAQHFDLSAHSVTSLMRRLARTRLLTSHIGKGGGFSLQRDPLQISVREVIEAIEGSLEPVECMLKRGRCEEQPQCDIFKCIQRAAKVMQDLFDSIPIGKMTCPQCRKSPTRSNNNVAFQPKKRLAKQSLKSGEQLIRLETIPR